jgi:TRAP-type C4-dicarboxylate transport system substrate-binding protein
VVGCLCAAVAAHAEPVVLKLGTVVPAGTSWARETEAFTRQVETATKGTLHIKWYLGGIAGDEVQMLDRVSRRQLDGIGSAGPACAHVSQLMRVMSVMGVFQTDEEVAYVLSRMLPQLEQEARQAGFVWLAAAPVGPEIVVSRDPVQDMNDLRRIRIHRWDVDDLANEQARLMGLKVVTLPLQDASRAYDEGRLDAFNFPPSAVLAYQVHSRARYLLDLRVGFISACLLVSTQAFDRLPLPAQQALREAGARLSVHFAMESRRQDDLLLGSVFTRSGMTALPVSEALRTEFFSAARAAREKMIGKSIPSEALAKVMSLLADYHAEHRP